MIKIYFIGIIVTLILHTLMVLVAAWQQKTFVNLINWYTIIQYIVLWPLYWWLFIKINFKHQQKK